MSSVINIVHGNHSEGAVTVEGIVSYLKACIKAAGYRVTLSSLPIAGRPNIVIDGFCDKAAKAMKYFSEQGASLILVATENVAPDGYWPGTSAPFVGEFTRFKNLVSIIPCFKAIWCMLPGQVVQYKETFSADKVFNIPHGYCDSYFQFEWVPEEERDIDFFFSGSLTEYRKDIIESLTARGFCCEAVPAATPMYISNGLISRSRICLALRQSPTWTSSSISRVHHYLMAKSYVICEACEEPSPLDAYTHIVQPEDFVETCVRTLEAGGLAEKAQERFEIFKRYEYISDEMDEIIQASL